MFQVASHWIILHLCHQEWCFRNWQPYYDWTQLKVKNVVGLNWQLNSQYISGLSKYYWSREEGTFMLILHSGVSFLEAQLRTENIESFTEIQNNFLGKLRFTPRGLAMSQFNPQSFIFYIYSPVIWSLWTKKKLLWFYLNH